MRRSAYRFGVAAFLGTALALLFVSHPRPGGAQVPPAPPGAPPATAPDEGPKPDSYLQYTFPEDRDSKQKLKAVTDYLDREDKKSIPWDIVCNAAQVLLQKEKSDSFYPLEATGAAKKGGRVSIKTKITEIIGSFPKEGKEFYELTFGGTADAQLKEAVVAGYDKAKIATVSQEYFHTKAGAQATLLLAVIDLEAGNYPEAAYGFQRLLARPDANDLIAPRTLFRAAVAFQRSGDVRQEESVAKLLERLQQKYPREGLTFGKKAYTFDELKAELGRPAELFGRVGDGLATMRLGNAAHTGIGNGGTPFLDPSFAIPMIYRTSDSDKDGADWVREKREDVLRSQADKSKGQVVIPGFFPVTAQGKILYRTYDGVYAVATKEGLNPRGQPVAPGNLLWMSPASGALQKLIGDSNNPLTPHAQSWWASWWASNNPTILYENAQVGSLSHDGKLVYFVNDLAVPPPIQQFNPNMGGFQPMPGGQQSQTNGLTDFSQLAAVDIETGKVVWSLGELGGNLTEEEELKTKSTALLTENSVFLGPPLPLNGKLYVLYERNNHIKLLCVDPNRVTPNPRPNTKNPKAPELVWVQDLGAPNTRVTQDSNRRVQPAYLAYADGVLVCPTNSGAVIAVDINARSLLWAQYYGTKADPNAMPGGGRIGRPGFNNPGNVSALPRDRWRASAPIIAGGKVVVSAFDSELLQCLDLRTGDVLWSDTRKTDDLYVGGVIGDKVLVVGKEAVRAYSLAGAAGKPSLAWQNLRVGTPCGHGTVSRDNLYYLPVVGSPDQKDDRNPAVWAIDVAAGQVKSKTEFRRKTADTVDPRLLLGNLLFHEGQLFAQSPSDLSAFPLIELKKQEMARLLKQNPNDPEGLFARGELSLDEGDVKAAIADFKAAEKNSPAEATVKRIDQKKYVAYTEILRNSFVEGEPFLAEYETLCSVTVDAEDPNEKQKQMDENVRRRGLYLSLVAKGREKQGRLVEAFENYRAFAALGDNKQLVSIYDEPNGMTRPDVWARGRIDAMIRGAKDAAARKPLEDRVLKDWNEIRAANDLPRLREFVKVFGPYFAAGREAQLTLAEKLLQTNNEDDLREAQTQLMQLWATSEDPLIAAKAVDTLARVMTRRGMLEDAVGLYAQLGTRYSEVVVRDGKTGAEIYGELITDKRLLPFLEPGRGPTSMRYKVEPQVGTNQRAYAQAFALKPDGELFPFFRRFALGMEASQTGDGSWTLRVTDKFTGEDRCKFAGLGTHQLVMGYGQTLPSHRIAQANGNLLLVNLGQFAYCFDLAEKREVWRYNLLGSAIQPANAQPRIETTKDGDIQFSFEDGWSLRLGRATILQPTYACLIARDSNQSALVAVDPTTGQKMWIRKGISPKVQIFGDARNIFVVDGNSTTVLRALDGSTVEDVKDFGALHSGTARVGMVGRNILLSESTTAESTRTMRLYDPLAAKDLWTKQLPAKSIPLKTINPEIAGYLTPEGKFEVFETGTGTSIFEGAIDADRVNSHMKDPNGTVTANAPLLLADAERFYLFLNRANAMPGNNSQYQYVRSVPVNGVAYGFDRTTGKRLWFNERLFESQYLYVERFDELPCLVAGNNMTNELTKAPVYQVAVLDKQLGKLKLYQGYQQQGFFTAVTADPKSRAIEFYRYDVRIRIAPDEDAKAAP